MLALRKVANRVITGICSKRAPGHGVHVALRAQVQLLGPSFFGVEAAKEKHHEGSELNALLRRDGLAVARFRENRSSSPLRTGRRIATIQSVVGETAA